MTTQKKIKIFKGTNIIIYPTIDDRWVLIYTDQQGRPDFYLFSTLLDAQKKFKEIE